MEMNKNFIKINLNDFSKIKKFVQIAQSFYSDIDIVKGNVCLDGKSLLGVMVLDLSENVYVRIISDDVAENRRFDAVMEEFR